MQAATTASLPVPPKSRLTARLDSSATQYRTRFRFRRFILGATPHPLSSASPTIRRRLAAATTEPSHVIPPLVIAEPSIYLLRGGA